MSLHDLIVGALDPRLLVLVKAAVMEGRPLALEAKARGTYIGSYDKWPTLTWLDSGFPSVHVEVLSGPTDYAKVFSSIPGYQAPANLGELDSFKALVEYGVSNDRIRAHFLPQRALDERNEMLEGLLAIQVRGLAIAIIDRSIHLFGEQDITSEQILPSYLELEAGVLADQLALEILVPLALTHVAADDRFQLDDFAYIERMSEETHLARYPRDSFWLPAHGIVVSAATHALVLSPYQTSAENVWVRHRSQLTFYPVQVVDRFFDAVRVVTGVDTGYAQVAIRPIGWAEDYLGSLPPLIAGPVIRRYPERFDSYGWVVADRPSISLEQLEDIRRLFTSLATVPPSVALAASRLSSAMLRSVEGDSIIDLCIGLEAMLTDDDKTEMTHKLALRVAAVWALSGETGWTPAEVFAAVKRIYAYRSKLVHGRSDASLMATISHQGEDLNTTDVAQQFLRTVIRTLIDHPEYQDAHRIDTRLIADALSGAASGAVTVSDEAIEEG